MTAVTHMQRNCDRRILGAKLAVHLASMLPSWTQSSWDRGLKLNGNCATLHVASGRRAEGESPTPSKSDYSSISIPPQPADAARQSGAPVDEGQDGVECARGVQVPPLHQVAEAAVVVQRDVAAGDRRRQQVPRLKQVERCHCLGASEGQQSGGPPPVTSVSADFATATRHAGRRPIAQAGLQTSSCKTPHQSETSIPSARRGSRPRVRAPAAAPPG
jgi:hypothetical protein